ncbi:MAG: DUF924 family protein [Pseudomonadota bacterium]
MYQQIVEFWFSDEISKLWYNSTPEFDQELIDRYEETWQQAARGELDHWMQTATGCLALAIVLDQFPLNMFRGKAASYSTEAKSREVAAIAIEKGFDQMLPLEQRAFLYMPYMHSESLQDQDYSLQLFDVPGLEGNLRFAHHHRSIVEKFGRFPHRNQALGRHNTEAEDEYLNSKEAFTG